jgi:hypothetical protein
MQFYRKQYSIDAEDATVKKSTSTSQMRRELTSTTRMNQMFKLRQQVLQCEKY